MNAVEMVQVERPAEMNEMPVSEIGAYHEVSSQLLLHTNVELLRRVIRSIDRIQRVIRILLADLNRAQRRVAGCKLLLLIGAHGREDLQEIDAGKQSWITFGKIQGRSDGNTRNTGQWIQNHSASDVLPSET